MAYPQPANVAPWYLRNITQALELDELTGNVFVRTGLTAGSTITITGNVIVGDIGVISLGNIDISGNSMPVTVESGNVTVFQGTDPWVVTGNTNVAITSGNVGITGNIAGITANVTVVDGGGSLTVDGNVGITGNANVVVQGNISGITNPVSVTGNVGIVGNVNATQGTDPWVVTGNTNVAITSGNVGITGNIAGITANVTVNPITGNVGITGNANVSGNVGILGNVNVTQGTSPWVVSGNVGITGNANVVLADDANVVISGFSGPTADAFGRLRVSNPFTIFDTQARYFDHGQFASNTAGTANVVYVSNQSSFQLNVGTASGDSVIRETVAVFPYQPGKSQLALNTFCMNTPKTNLRQRVGMFGADNGVFFENDGTYNYFVIRSASTGVEERVRQDAWNTDTLNPIYSPNPSGITLSVDRAQIMFADVEWLGVGTVRVGFVIDGAYIICHRFNHANQAGNTKVYMTTATLPIRYEITNTGITANASMMTQICSSVISEGGFQLSGSPGAIGHGLGNAIVLPNDSSFLPLLSIRLKSTNLDAVVVPTKFTIAPTASSTFKYRVYRRAVTSGGTWANVSANSSVAYNLAPTAVVSGDIGQEDFIITSNQTAGAPIAEGFDFEFQLERNSFTGVAYEYVLTAATTGTNQNVYAAIEWQEIT